MKRCHARDTEGRRCMDDQEDHPRVTTKDGFIALSHHTRKSWWVERTIVRAPRLITPEEMRRR